MRKVNQGHGLFVLIYFEDKDNVFKNMHSAMTTKLISQRFLVRGIFTDFLYFFGQRVF